MSADAQITYAVLEGSRHHSSDWADAVLEECRGPLLLRRNQHAETEAETIDLWGDALDQAELINAAVGGHLDIVNGALDTHEFAVESETAWAFMALAATRATEIADDMLDMLRRGSRDTALALTRSLHEACLIARVLAIQPHLVPSFWDYQARAALRTRADFYRSLIGYLDGAGKNLRHAERSLRELTADRSLRRGDLGWAHDALVEADQEYGFKAKKGFRDAGPNLAELGRLTDTDPADQAIRAMANPHVHLNVINSSFLEDEGPEFEGMLLRAIPRQCVSAVLTVTNWGCTLLPDDPYELGEEDPELGEALEVLEGHLDKTIDRIIDLPTADR